MPPPSSRLGLRPVSKLPTLVLLGVALFLAADRLGLALVRDFDPDELQHMHGGFMHSLGARPYVDYFEHHTPWVPAALGGLISWLGPEWGTLMVARVLSALLGIAGLAATWLLFLPLARVRGGSRNAPLVAIIVHAVVVTGLDKGIEIRPDVPAALLFTLALCGAFAALRAGGGARPALLGGLSLGAALMCTPKCAFGALGLGFGALFFIAMHGAERRRRMTRLIQLVAASFLPLLATAAWLAGDDLLGAFWRDVVTGPMDWKREIDPFEHLSILVRRNPLVVATGLVGWVAMLCRGIAWRKEVTGHAEPGFIIIPFCAAAILAGWFLVPVPWPQFLMPLWPLLACGTAELFSRIEDGASAAVFGGAVALVGLAVLFSLGVDLDAAGVAFGAPGLMLLAGSLWLLAQGRAAGTRLGLRAVAVLGLAVAAVKLQPSALPFGLLWFLLATFFVVVPSSARVRAASFVLVVGGPLLFIGKQRSDRPVTPFRAEFDHVMESTAPDDAILTGWRGCAVFRPHAYRFFFLHKGVVQMLTPEQRNEDVVAALRATRPPLAIRDEATRSLGPDVQRYLDEHYAPTGIGDLWVRER